VIKYFILFIVAIGPVSAAKDVSIEEIKFSGLDKSENENALRTVEIEPGDIFESVRVARSATNLRLYLVRKGYYQASVKTELARENMLGRVKTILSFIVDRGPPTRVNKVSFVPYKEIEESSRAWRDIEGELEQSFSLTAGSLLDRDQISNRKTEIENFLVSGEYVGAKVVTINTYDSSAPAKFESGSVSGEWVDVEFLVDIGDRITFGFRGNSVFGRNELMEMIDQRRQVGFGPDFNDDIKNELIAAYKNLGYAAIKIESYSFVRKKGSERHVTFVINEGPRYRIKELYFDGNFVFSGDELYEVFHRNSPRNVKNGYFIQSDINRGALLLIDWMRSKGYLSSKLISINSILDDKNGTANVFVFIYEGEQTRVRSINIDGLTFFSTEVVRDLLGVRTGDSLNLYKFSEGVERLKSKYKEEGYLNFSILNEESKVSPVISYIQKNQWADVYLDLSEGPRFKVASVETAGLEKTKSEVVEREVEFEPGQVLRESGVRKSEQNIRRLGIFSSVKSKVIDVEGSEDEKRVLYVLQEGSPGSIGGGLGIRNDLGARVFGEIGYSNLWGKSHGWVFSAATNRRFNSSDDEPSTKTLDDGSQVEIKKQGFRFIEYQTRLGYRWPWFAIPKVTFRPEFSHEKRQFFQFNAETTSLRATLSRPVFEKPNLDLLLTYSLERTRQFDAVSDIDNQTLRIGSLIPGYRFDLRDDPLAPSSGFYSTGSYEVASTLFGSQSDPFPVGFTRAQFRADQFFTLFGGVRLHLSFRTGFERNTISESEVPEGVEKKKAAIPLSKQFALGGASSLRGFKLQELNKQNLAIRGTLSYANYRTQLDLPFAGPMTLGPFLDAANLTVDSYSAISDLRYGAGIGIRYYTPVGPVNFDWGFKMNRRDGEEPSVFYFSVGAL